ncbi:hypothetical protein N7474_004116 [Penicillium riverlandense]|uniref:uncharacterized protein n=1 Tax=Penicillium riverlandense TaxID=1903569 RepID=UPI0025471F8E|nr:uncharacterized protein N7474_004116 [Penicillium riverlandense]KAJ5818525.1 hypothetical protein N7474_004116 [Penicillium riverlandense]
MLRRPPTAIFLSPDELQADLHRIHLTLYFTRLRLDDSSQRYEDEDEEHEEDSTLIDPSNPSSIDSCASAASTISDAETDIHGGVEHTANWMGHAVNLDINRVQKTLSWKDVGDAPTLTLNETQVNINTNKASRSMVRASRSVDSLRREITSTTPSSQTTLGAHNGNPAVATGPPLADVPPTTVSGEFSMIDTGQRTRDRNTRKPNPNPRHRQSAGCVTTSETQSLASGTSPSRPVEHTKVPLRALG